jgi:SAM-dependent methyltransferase
MSTSNPDDPFSRVNYRSLIAWPARIEREWPFLEWGLASAPERSVLDLGCGTGEHARFLAERRYRAVGIDSSAAQIEKAREYEAESGSYGPCFIEGDMLDLPNLTRERFGAAMCLGNVFPYMKDDELEPRLRALAQALLPGGRLLVQLLNYARIIERGVRHLPLNFRPDPENDDGEIVWVRLMRAADPGYVLFHPVTLRTRPGLEPPVELQAAREVRLRAWSWPELGELLRRCSFHELQAFGDMQRTPYDPSTSNDLIFVATRQA